MTKKLEKNSTKETISNRIIASFADIHFGKSEDPEHLYKELIYLFDKIKEKKPDIIAILGDLFDKELKVNSLANTYCNKFVFDLYDYSKETGCCIVLLHGTLFHDRMQLNSYSHFCYENFRIYNTTKDDYIKDLKIWMIPEEYEDDKQKFYKNYLNKSYDFVFGHGMISYVGFFAQTESARRNKIVWDDIDFKNITGKALFGHIHIKQRAKYSMYIGSTSRMIFGEEEEKGVYIYTYDTINKCIIDEEFIENVYAPKYNTINIKNLSDNPDKMLKELIEYSNSCYKLRVLVDSETEESKYYNVKSFESSHKNKVIVYKKIKGLTSNTVIQNEEAEKRREERSKLLESYRNLDFFQITKKIALEKYDTKFSTQEINELVFSDK